MNLQNLNVTELSAQEVQETEGGGAGLWFVGAILGGIIYETISDIDGNIKAFKESYNEALDN